MSRMSTTRASAKRSIRGLATQGVKDSDVERFATRGHSARIRSIAEARRRERQYPVAAQAPHLSRVGRVGAYAIIGILTVSLLAMIYFAAVPIPR